MIRAKVAEILESDQFLQEFHVKGWVRSFRSNRFIALNDGSTIKNLQCVIDFENTEEEILKKNHRRSGNFCQRNAERKPGQPAARGN